MWIRITSYNVCYTKLLWDFSYAEHFSAAPTTGYETLLYDCMTGDATLFKRADNIEEAWALMDPVLDVWSALPARDRITSYNVCYTKLLRSVTITPITAP